MSNFKELTVAVIIPAHNAEQYIARAIRSVLNQTIQPNEIIVVDDGSEDRTAEIVKSFGEEVKYIYQVNQRVAAARNTGICAAESDWIALLDADDEWLPNKIELQLAVIRQNPDIEWCAGNYIRVLETEDRQAPDLTIEKSLSLLDGKNYTNSYYEAFQKGLRPIVNVMLIRKETIAKAGMFNPQVVLFEDQDMWFRIAATAGKFGWVTEPTAIYHIDIPGSMLKDKHPAEVYASLMRRHLAIAGENNKLNEFTPCAAKLLRQWMRAMLFDARKDDIRQLLDEFASILPAGYVHAMRMLTACPNASANVCRMASRIIRTFGLRQRVVAKPTPRK